jgi:hypothetical protein
MYKPFEILARTPASVGYRMYLELSEKNPPLIETTLDTLAKQRKLRPIFLERKSVEERAKWVQDMLGKTVNNSSAAYFLQIWLVACHTPMLKAFLSALNIPHDENGTIEELPSAPDLEALKPAVDKLFAEFDPGVVRVYLHAFQAFDLNGWPSLAILLAEDERLKM